ncbi:MAG: carboxypeptidase regulatory-like domain-containing protein [Planctomycetota bacterium]
MTVEASLFEIGPLLPGRWRLHATLDFFERSRTVYVEVPGQQEDEIKLTFSDHDALEISGRVIDGETSAPERAHVSLVTSTGSSSMTTGAEGRFRFTGRKPRAYTLCAQTVDGRVGFQPDVKLGATSLEDVVLAVFPSARLQLSVQGERSSSRCQILAGGDLYQDFTLNRGVTTLQAVPATSIEVIIYSRKNGQRVVHDWRSVLATPGTTIPLEFAVD